MKISVLFLVVSLTYTVVAMDDQPKGLQYLSGRNENSTTMYWGIVDTSTTGTLDCYVYHDSRANAYYGALHNNKYESEKKWLTKSLLPAQAQYYYEQL